MCYLHLVGKVPGVSLLPLTLQKPKPTYMVRILFKKSIKRKQTVLLRAQCHSSHLGFMQHHICCIVNVCCKGSSYSREGNRMSLDRKSIFSPVSHKEQNWWSKNRKIRGMRCFEFQGCFKMDSVLRSHGKSSALESQTNYEGNGSTYLY